VVMVHGLWSSPLTWMHMFNDLRSFPEVRERYQFWFYLYPTGQPFWISATQMRNDLAAVRERFDPQRTDTTLDQMVLVGHSMGGLVSRMQTIDSRDDFWRIISDEPWENLQAEEEDRMKLASTLFFKPNSSIRRVITIGTPHRGSDFANNYTQWLGRKLITLPSFAISTGQRLRRENPDFFKNTDLLTANTAIDSLSPRSPIFPVMLRAPRADGVKYHNIVGIVEKRSLFGRISATGDGVVSYASAQMDDVESEVVVEADHTTLHHRAHAILEVRRILLEHLDQIDAEIRVAGQSIPVGNVQPASADEPVAVP
jgi:pimeloyl-ACP methyl ester carboxylesterase